MIAVVKEPQAIWWHLCQLLFLYFINLKLSKVWWSHMYIWTHTKIKCLIQSEWISVCDSNNFNTFIILWVGMDGSVKKDELFSARQTGCCLNIISYTHTPIQFYRFNVPIINCNFMQISFIYLSFIYFFLVFACLWQNIYI